MTQRKDTSLMGKRVRVYAEFDRAVTERKPWKVTWVRIFPKQKRGWVVGYRNVYEGEIVEQSCYSSIEDYEPAYFAPRKTIPCLLVAYNPWQNPVKVPRDAVKEV